MRTVGAAARTSARGACYRPAMRRVPIPLLVPLIVIALPVAVPIALALHKRDQRRMRMVAGLTRCEQCGTALGLASLRYADLTWADHVAALRRSRPNAVFRLARHVWARCAACGAEYDYDPGARVFHRVAASGMPGEKASVETARAITEIRLR